MGCGSAHSPSRGVQIEFVTPLASVGPLMEHWSLDEWTRRFQERGVRFWPAHDMVEWNGALRLHDVQTGAETICAASGETTRRSKGQRAAKAAITALPPGDINKPRCFRSRVWFKARTNLHNGCWRDLIMGEFK